MLSLIICVPVIIAFLFLKHVRVAPSEHMTTESSTSLELPLSSYSDGDSDDDCFILEYYQK